MVLDVLWSAAGRALLRFGPVPEHLALDDLGHPTTPPSLSLRFYSAHSVAHIKLASPRARLAEKLWQDAELCVDAVACKVRESYDAASLTNYLWCMQVPAACLIRQFLVCAHVDKLLQEASGECCTGSGA